MQFMGSQVLGSLVILAGIFFLVVAGSNRGAQEAVSWLTGVVIILSGLLLGALGRIQTAIQESAGREQRGKWLPALLLCLPLLIAVAGALLWFFWSSGPAPARRPQLQGP